MFVTSGFSIDDPQQLFLVAPLVVEAGLHPLAPNQTSGARIQRTVSLTARPRSQPPEEAEEGRVCQGIHLNILTGGSK